MRRGAALLLPLVVAGLLLSPPGALAQGGLIASSPRAQAVLTSAPTAVELVFSTTPVLDSSHVAVFGPDGGTVSTGELRRGTGPALRQPLAIRGTGDFTVAYHVEFEGGGQATGQLRFSVGTGAAPQAADRAAADAAASAVAAHGHGVDPVSAVLLVVDGLVVLGVVAMLYLRRPSRPGPPPDPDAGRAGG